MIYASLLHSNGKKETSATQLIATYYDVMLNLIDVNLMDSDHQDRIIQAIDDAKLLAEQVTAGPEGEVMTSLLKVLHFLREKPSEFLGNPVDRVQEVEACALSERFSPEKVALVGLLKIWASDLVIRDSKNSTLVEVVSRELPLTRMHAVEVHLITISESLFGGSLLLRVDDEAKIDLVNEQGEVVPWSTRLPAGRTHKEDGWQFGLVDYKFLIRSYHDFEKEVRFSFTMFASKDPESSVVIQQGYFSVHLKNLTPNSGMFAEHPNDFISRWKKDMAKQGASSSSDNRYIFTVRGGSVAELSTSTLVARVNGEIFRPLDPVTEKLPSPQNGSIVIAEYPRYILWQRLRDTESWRWEAYLGGILGAILPGLIFTEDALSRLDKFFHSISEKDKSVPTNEFQVSFLNRLGKHVIEDKRLLYLDDRDMLKLVSSATELELFIGALRSSYETFTESEQNLLRGLLVATSSAEDLVEAGQLVVHIKKLEQSQEIQEIFRSMDSLVNRGWCRREKELLYGFSSLAYRKCVAQTRGLNAAEF